MFSENFSGDLGDDQLGFAVESFTKAAAGTGLAADAEEISKKLTALGELAATHPPMDKLRAAVQDLESTVQAVKSKL
ncbi:MAG: hypothetical protein HY000_15760 [Planctomycetes bacterium]|nr:hypothetical protein [Planctomycetota bacterium]